MDVISAITNKNFLECVKESKELSLMQKKEVKRVSNNKIIKTRVAQLYVTGMYNRRQISDMLCISYNTVCKILKQEQVIDMIEKYQEEEKPLIDAKLKALREQATDTLSDLLNSDEDNVRLQTAKVILDKTGHGDKKEQTTNINVSYEERLNSVISGVSFDVKDLEFMPTEE